MSTQQQEADATAQNDSSLSAEGHYTNVTVHPIQHQGTLRNGTGTMSAIGVFSCGVFDEGDQPVIGNYYNITGSNGLNLPGWKCVHSGPTSDFKAR